MEWRSSNTILCTANKNERNGIWQRPCCCVGLDPVGFQMGLMTAGACPAINHPSGHCRQSWAGARPVSGQAADPWPGHCLSANGASWSLRWSRLSGLPAASDNAIGHRLQDDGRRQIIHADHLDDHAHIWPLTTCRNECHGKKNITSPIRFGHHRFSGVFCC